MSGIDVNKMSPVQRLDLIRQGEAALKRRKDDPQIHYQLALLHKANGSMDNAVSHLQKVIKTRKADKDALAQLADIYVKAQDFAKARKYVRRLVEAYPRDELVLIYHAEFLEKASLVKQAEAAWERIVKLFPNNIENLASLAACKRQLGNWEEANELAKQVLEQKPNHAPSLYMLANSAKHEPDIARKLIGDIGRAIAENQTPDAIGTANLHYASGKLNAELGQYEQAMVDYTAANDQRDAKPWAELKKPFDNARAGFTRNFISEKALMGNQSRAPVFILGMPRSGTTLTESLLGAHSQVVAGDEMTFIDQIASRTGIAGGQTDAFVKLLHRLDEPTIRSMAKDYLDATEHLRKGQTHFTDKLPHNFKNMGFIRILFPNAKIIHCRRHPVDNCLSLYTNSMTPYHNGYKTNLKTLGLYYRQYVQLMEHWRREVPGGFHEVFYEDLVANTELNARAMIDYLGLEWEDSVMKRENSQKSVRTLSVWQVRQPVYTSSAGRWKKFEPYLGELIDALGGTIAEYESELAGLGEQAPA